MRVDLPDAGQTMTAVLEKIAEKSPAYADSSGKVFWPIPAAFPLLLTKTLHLLQTEITRLYLAHNPLAKQLADARMLFMKLMYEGDLGENHTDLFLVDHPSTKGITTEESNHLPFSRFCDEALKIENFATLCGLICRNEIGSVAEANRLEELKMVIDGPYNKIHKVEEIEHARASEKIADIFMESPYKEDFVLGMELHDTLYKEALN